MTRLEKTATATLIGSFLLLAGVLTRSYIVSRQPELATIPRVKIGEKFKIPGVRTDAARHTLVIVITSQCPYCVRDLPLYKKLSALRGGSGGALRLIAVMPDPTETSAKFLGDAGVLTDSVVSATPLEIGVPMIPTVMLLDHRGAVEKYWVGETSREQRKQVLAEVMASCSECRVPEQGGAESPADVPAK